MWRVMHMWFLLFTICCSEAKTINSDHPQLPCIFIFGDSLSDSGNNNRLRTTGKTNYPPYGIDFPSGQPTGRFTNGRTTVDFIAEHLGFKGFIPPFSDANTGVNISKGINYASGGAGIRTETGRMLTLYDNGARKVALFGLGFIGCTIAEISMYGASRSGCVDRINNAVLLFNEKLVSLVDELNGSFSDAKFTYLNTTAITPSQGFKVLNASCCQVNRLSGLCLANSIPCSNKSEYFFWDSFHPTEAVNVITGGRAYNAQEPSYAHPLDISQLASLSLPN
ncbi:hypothetical protein Ancab_005530 [Ancistrocladus abbreviatus]